MKQKKQSKLSFKKATVANLNNLQMRGAKGGDDLSGTCPEDTCPSETCPSLDPPTCKPLDCKPSLMCPTPNTDWSWCECPTAIC